jgi:hypothetical protein
VVVTGGPALATVRTDDADATDTQHSIATRNESANDAMGVTVGILHLVQKATSRSAADVAPTQEVFPAAANSAGKRGADAPQLAVADLPNGYLICARFPRLLPLIKVWLLAMPPYVAGPHSWSDKFAPRRLSNGFGQFPFVCGDPLANQFDGSFLIGFVCKKIPHDSRVSLGIESRDPGVPSCWHSRHHAPQLSSLNDLLFRLSTLRERA